MPKMLLMGDIIGKFLMMMGFSSYVIQESKFIIIKSEMTESMKRHALGTAMVAFEEPGIPIHSKKTDIAEKLTNEFNSQYGRHWFCLVGPPGFVSHFDYVPNTLLWFSYKDIQVIMFKLSRVSQMDVIREARRTDKIKMQILRCEMSESMKAYAITSAMIAFQEYNSYETISANISSIFDQMHGQHWQCVIGVRGFNARFSYVPGTYISFAFSDAQLTLFRINKQIEPSEVIVNARASLYHPIIEYNSIETKLRNNLLRVAIESIYRHNTFVDIARSISGSLAQLFNVYWSCVVGHHLFHAEEISECHNEAVSVHFGELRVLLCANDSGQSDSDSTGEYGSDHHNDLDAEYSNIIPSEYSKEKHRNEKTNKVIDRIKKKVKMK